MRSSVIIDNLDVVRVAVPPHETDSIGFVYSDAVLPRSISLEGFQPVAWRHPQVVQRQRGV